MRLESEIKIKSKIQIQKTLFVAGLLAAVLLGGIRVWGQANLPIYTDHLVNGFQDWGWGARNLANTGPYVHTGTMSISASNAYGEAISFYHADFDTSLYNYLSFWLNGGPGGGQVLQVQALLSQVQQ